MRMGPVEVALCKIGAVYLFVSAAGSLSWTVYPLLSGDDHILAAMFGVLLTLFVPLVGGVALWRYSDRASSAGSDSTRDVGSTPLSKDDLTEVGVALVGLYAILFGLVAAVNLEILDWSHRISAEEDSFMYELRLSQNWSRRVGYVVQIALGLFLIRGRQSIVVLLSR